ncbi:hypothetical protein NFJ02_42g109130 [Pycnococcus provasolii]
MASGQGNRQRREHDIITSKLSPEITEHILHLVAAQPGVIAIRNLASATQACKAFQQAAGGRAALALRAIAQDQHDDLVVRGLKVLRSLGECAVPHIPAIIVRLKHSEYKVSKNAMRALLALREHAVAYIADIVPLLNEDTSHVRVSALVALKSFRGYAIPKAAATPRSWIRRLTRASR